MRVDVSQMSSRLDMGRLLAARRTARKDHAESDLPMTALEKLRQAITLPSGYMDNGPDTEFAYFKRIPLYAVDPETIRKLLAVEKTARSCFSHPPGSVSLKQAQELCEDVQAALAALDADD